MRVGIGYDIHRLAGGRLFVLGSVVILYPLGPVGHSDGDVLLHALVDALLGAAGLGDIGRHFSASDEQWRGVASRDLLARTMQLVVKAGFGVENVDATVVLEQPRLAEYLPLMVECIAQGVGVSPDQVNVKAKTNEGLDAIGERRAVAAHAAVLLRETNMNKAWPSTGSGND